MCGQFNQFLTIGTSFEERISTPFMFISQNLNHPIKGNHKKVFYFYLRLFLEVMNDEE